MKSLSLVIPAHNEEGCIENTIRSYNSKLKEMKIKHELLVVNDHSTDRTEEILIRLEKEIKELRHINNKLSNGFGNTVVSGLRNFKGDYVAIVMADLSDTPQDVVNFYYEIKKGFDAVFGSRFNNGGEVIDYPSHKLFLNRFGNFIIKILFGIRYNDVTNAFKMYRKETIAGLEPIISKQFNLTVELPLKTIVRGFSYSVLPNKWINRKEGVSKFKIKEMGSRYFFIIFYCLLEKWLSKGDYKKNS